EVEGYQHNEIAQMLDCSVGNSKSQLHKAKMKMRDLLFPKRKILRRSAATAAIASQSPEKDNGGAQLYVAYSAVSEGRPTIEETGDVLRGRD
ncbi:MAG: sigma factor-like helix-turn-helix DNA-binding protein, partial [Candidatus Sulfotelmatobacter sp.]